MRFFVASVQFFVVIVLVLETLTGCMVGPDYRSPEAPQVKSYTSPHLPLKTTTVPSMGAAGKAQYLAAGQDLPAEWWFLFHSQAINSLVVQGLDNSPNLAAAEAVLRQAQENLYAQTGSLMYPALSAQVAASRQKFSDSSLGISNRASLFNLYNPTFNISYTLDVFGNSRRQLEALAAQVDYQAFQLEAAYLTLTTNIVTTAINAASFHEQIEATKELIKIQGNTLTILKKQYQLGGASAADMLTQETQVAQLRATLPPLEQSYSQALHALAVLIGTFPEDKSLPQIELSCLDLPQQLPLSVPSILAKQRPDIRASEALLHVASAKVGVATANLYPQITLNGTYGWESNTLPALFSPVSVMWNYGSQITQPIFNGGALRAYKRAAVAAFEQANAQYRQTVLQAFRNVADTLRAIHNDALTFQAEREAELAAKRSLRLIQQQFHLGGVSYLSLLNAQRQYQQTKINRIQAQAARYTDTVALFQALGGGWWNRTQVTEGQPTSLLKGA